MLSKRRKRTLANTPSIKKYFVKNESVEETPHETNKHTTESKPCKHAGKGDVNTRAARKLLVSLEKIGYEEEQLKNKEIEHKFNGDSSDDYDSDDSDSENLSEKIQQRHRMLQEKKSELVNRLNISSITAALETKRKLDKTSTPKRQRPAELLTPTRSSLRIKKQNPLSLNEKDLERLAEEKQEEEAARIKPRIKTEGFKMVGLGFDEFIEDEKDFYTAHDLFMKNIARSAKEFDRAKPVLSKSDKEYASILKSLKLNENSVTKVTPSRIFSLAFHANTNKTILAAGDKEGYLGIWDVNNNPDINGSVYQFRPHVSPISTLKFSNSDPNKLFMCSYDGTIRYADLSKSEISGVIVDDQSYSFSGFEFLSQDSDNCIVASCYHGEVVVIDRREDNNNRFRAFDGDPKRLKSISVHPKISHYICAANPKGYVHFFDLRKFSLTSKNCQPFASIDAHARSINSAYFDPQRGDKVVTVSWDDKIKILNTENIKSGIVSVSNSVKHNNNTGRWLSSFRSVWHPFQENIFAVGNMQHPRQIDILNSNLDIVHQLRNEYLTTICSTITFHPSRHIIAGGNSSGKVFVFK